MLPAILLADLSHGNVFAARTNGLDFLKILVYYLLLVGLVDSPERLRKFLVAVALLVTLLAGLALLEYRKVINIPALAPMVEGVGEDAEIDETAVIVRLMATGIFHDPNDFSLVVGASIMIGLYWIFEQRNWLVRILWLGAIATLTYAFVLTQSRGGFVGLSAGTTAILLSRFGWRRSLPILAIVLPCVLVAGGRQTSIDLTDTGDTGHGRIQLWRDSLVLFRTAPVFGIGAGQLAEENELVAHNSYVQAFAELGLVGGTLFVGAWYLCLTVIRKGGDAIAGASFDTLQVLRWRPYVLGMLMTYACGLFSLTRCYAVSTYVILGSGAAYAHIISSHLQVSSSFSGRLCLRVLAVGGLSILGLYVFVHIF